MKQLVLLLAAGALTAPAFAQELSSNAGAPAAAEQLPAHYRSPVSTIEAGKTSGLTREYNLANDSMLRGTSSMLYIDFQAPLDSGFFYGTNALGYKGFAQHYYTDYDASGNNDTTTQITGFFSKWGGNAQTGTSSSKTVNFSIWKRGTNKSSGVIGHPVKFYVYGTPVATTTATRSVAANTLALNGNATITYLTTPVSVSENVYVGYTMTYTWRPTDSLIGLRRPTVALNNYYDIETGTGDTLLTANNLIQTSAGTWQSVRYQLGVTNGADQIIAPLVKLSCPNCTVGINGFHSNDLTFFGNYPNPAVNTTNVRFAMARNNKVVITIYDNAGREVKAIDLGVQTTGEHVVPVNTSALAAGNYVYTVETSEGGRVASQMTIVK